MCVPIVLQTVDMIILIKGSKNVLLCTLKIDDQFNIIVTKVFWVSDIVNNFEHKLTDFS